MFNRDQFIYFLLVVLFFSSCDNNSTTKVSDKKVTGWAMNDNGDSVYMRYDDQNRLSSYTTYKNGLKNGLAKKFYKNGKTQFDIIYKNGLKEGLTKWYYETGKLYRETTYHDDEVEGIQRKYYENGKLMAEIPYKNGEVIPGLKEYTKSGKLKEIYPDLIIRPADKLAFENKYTLQVYFSDKPKTAKYFRVIQNENGDIAFMQPLEESNGVGEMDYFVARGSYVMKKEVFRGTFNTSLGNEFVAEKSYNLAVDN